MGRKSVNPVSAMFFDYNKGNNTSKCKISDCPHPIMKGKHSMTLEKHVEHRHPESYLKLVKAKERIQNLDGDSDNDDYDSRNKKLKVRNKIITSYLISKYEYFEYLKLWLGNPGWVENDSNLETHRFLIFF